MMPRPQLYHPGRSLTALLFALAFAATSSAAEASPNADAMVAGPLTLYIHISSTANLFHIVDQVSQWSPFCHEQYVAMLGELSSDDQRLLAKHREIRKRYGWGQGLEQTFYTGESVEAALDAAEKSKVLDQQSIETERQILRHFEPRVAALVENDMARLKAFRDMLRRRSSDLQTFARKAAQFSGVTQVSVPVFLIANPDDYHSGGGFNGGRLTLEVPRKANPWPLVFHELTHAFLETKRPLLTKAASRVEGLDSETLGEGLVYSVPSLFEQTEYEHLSARVAKDFASRKAFSEPYVRFNRFGLALRPLIKEAWDNGLSIEDILPRVVDVWLAIREISPKPVPQIFCAGPGWQALGKRVKLTYSTNHRPEHYRQLFERSHDGDIFVLMFALDNSDKKVPAQYLDLLPSPWSDIEKQLEAGLDVALSGAARGRRVILLAAPSRPRLEHLISSTPLLKN